MLYRKLSYLLLLAWFPFAAKAQLAEPSGKASSTELFKASVLTPAKSFTSDVEGPGVDKAGNLYAANFDHSGTIGIVTPEGVASVFIELPKGSISNSIRFDSHGNMIIGDYKGHNVFKLDMATKKLTLVANEPRMNINAPNDMAIDSKDRIYASDPNYRTRTGRVWRIDPNGKVTLLDTIDAAANGIEVSPDEKTLYVDGSKSIWAYDLSSKGEVSNKRLLIEFPDPGVDGMRIDTEGNLYIARIGKSVIQKISPAGKILQDIKLTGVKPTNVAFGGKDGRTVYVTLMDQGNLESFRVDTPGREWKMQRKK